MIRWQWFVENFPQVWDLTKAHLWLSIPPIIAAVLIAVPLGFAASQRRSARGLIVGGTGLLYAIPSLAFFTCLPFVLGTSILSPLNVHVALTVYGVAVLTRFVSDAFLQVPVSAQDAAMAVGYAPMQRLISVELPLAGPVLLAGVRVVSASTVSLVSVGSLVGVHGLGYLFTDGFNRSFPTEILAGVVATALVALVCDRLLVAVGAVMMPWQRKGRGLHE